MHNLLLTIKQKRRRKKHTSYTQYLPVSKQMLCSIKNENNLLNNNEKFKVINNILVTNNNNK